MTAENLADPARSGAGAEPGSRVDVSSAAGVPVGERPGRDLFVYGTLMFGDIVEALLYRRPVLAPAAVAGWRVARLPGRVYPGLVPAAGRQAEGLLLPGLSAAEWAMLDDFEGDEYVVRPVQAELRAATGADQAPPVAALTYAWRAVDSVDERDWDRNWFATHWLSRYAP